MAGPRALSCPSCGGAVLPPLGSRKTRCEFCDKAFYYAGKDFLPRLALRSNLSEEGLHDACMSLFKGLAVPGDLARRALLLQKHRMYLPFYFMTGKRGGVLQTNKERIDHSWKPRSVVDKMAAGSGGVSAGFASLRRPEVIVEEDSSVVLGDFKYLYQAVSLENWNFSDADLEASVLSRLGEAKPVALRELVKSGKVADVSIPLETVMEKGVGTGSTMAGALKVLELTTVVVYVPVQIVTFRYGQAIFNVVVEELEGRVVSGSLPFRRGWAFLGGLTLIAGLGFFIGQFARTIIEMVSETPAQANGYLETAKVLGVLCVVLSIIATAGLNAAWLFFRTPYFLKLTSKGGRLESPIEPPRSPLNPVTALIQAFFRRAFPVEVGDE